MQICGWENDGIFLCVAKNVIQNNSYSSIIVRKCTLNCHTVRNVPNPCHTVTKSLLTIRNEKNIINPTDALLEKRNVSPICHTVKKLFRPSLTTQNQVVTLDDL